MSEEMKPSAALEPVAVDSLPWEESQQGVRFASRARTLSRTRTPAGLRIGVYVEELPPGKQSCPFHYHLLEEEHILMLAGEVTLRLGDRQVRFAAGEFVSFPAGAPRGHCLVNQSGATARYLVIGDHNPNEVCIYPDSGKVQLRALNRAVHELGPKRDYWDGERQDEALSPR
jgi:uncharacterized cupin superfamily protein